MLSAAIVLAQLRPVLAQAVEGGQESLLGVCLFIAVVFLLAWLGSREKQPTDRERAGLPPRMGASVALQTLQSPGAEPATTHAAAEATRGAVEPDGPGPREQQSAEEEVPDEEEVRRGVQTAARWAIGLGVAQFLVFVVYIALLSDDSHGNDPAPAHVLTAPLVGAVLAYCGWAIRQRPKRARPYLLFLIVLCSFAGLLALLTERPFNFAVNLLAVLAFVAARRRLPEPPSDEQATEKPPQRRYSARIEVDSAAAPPSPPPAPSHGSPYDTLRQLAALRDEGVLTEEEFDEKKRDILSRL